MNTNQARVSLMADFDIEKFLAGGEEYRAVMAAYAKPSPKSEEKSSRTTAVNTAASALITPKAPKGSKGPKAQKEEKAPPIVQLAPKGDLSAKGFITALRTAGIRQATDLDGNLRYMSNGCPLMVCDPIAQRADEQTAVTGFIGWTSEPHGTQLDRATLRSRYDLAIKPIRALGQEIRMYRDAGKHTASWSVSGFVAGLPNATAKLLQDLGARERLAVEELSAAHHLLVALAEKDAKRFETVLTRVEKDDPIFAQVVRSHADQWTFLSFVETLAQARLEAIRADIDSLDGENLSPERVEAAHQAMLNRGAVQGMTLMEEYTILADKPKAD